MNSGTSASQMIFHCHVSLIPRRDGDVDELTVLDVHGFPISWQWYVGHPKGKRLSVVARTFIDFMHEEGPSLLPKNTN